MVLINQVRVQRQMAFNSDFGREARTWPLMRSDDRPAVDEPIVAGGEKHPRARNGIAAGVAAVDRAQEDSMSQIGQQSFGVKDQNDLSPSFKSPQMTIEPVFIRPEENEPVQEPVPVGRGHTITESRFQQTWRHWPLITDVHSVAKDERIRAMSA